MKPFGKFDGPIATENLQKGKKKLTNSLVYKGVYVSPDGLFSIAITTRCRKGFVTDLGSVPGLAKVFVDDDDGIARGSVPHDGIYRYKPCCRALGDAIALQQWLDDEKFDNRLAYLCYYILRPFGLIGWLQNKRQNKEIS